MAHMLPQFTLGASMFPYIEEPEFVEVALATWDRITAPIVGAQDVFSAFGRPWSVARSEGKYLPVEYEICATLRQETWAWPWFEEWLETFSKHKLQPWKWDRVLRPERWTRISDEVAKILLHTIMLSTQLELNRRSDLRILQYVEARWTLRATGEAPGVIDLAVASHVAAFEAGYPHDPSVLPPYFPSDMTWIDSWIPGETPKPLLF